MNACKRFEDELRALVGAWDPLSVFDDPTWPRDEYDCLLGPLLSRLQRGAPAEDISAFLGHELRDHFGIEPRPGQPTAFVATLVAWFTAGGAGSAARE